MGGGSFDARSWAMYKTSKVDSARGLSGSDGLFKSTRTSRKLSPKGVELRESRDSVDHPMSNAIVIGLDYSGSMGIVSGEALKNLGTLMQELLSRKPITDPQLMFMGYSDVEVRDRDCFQLTQFESDIRIAEQLQEMYLAGGGGGNDHESDHLVWYFAGFCTSIDCFEKRGKKGYLFTVGDEEAPDCGLTAANFEHVFGSRPEWTELSLDDILARVKQKYNVYHIIVEQGSHAKIHYEEVKDSWERVLPQHVISLSDITKLAETIVSTIQIGEGAATADSVAATWSGDTSIVVADAVKDLVANNAGSSTSTSTEVVRF